VVALPFGSRPLAIWGTRLPDWAQPVQNGLQAWDEAMERAGLTAPYDAVHQAMRDLVERPF
jgi:hypothetical protein